MSTTRAYQSSNGDTWELVRDDATRHAHVRHTPAPASGGEAADIPLNDFLNAEPNSPQHQAVASSIDAVTSAEQSGEKVRGVRGYVHDPKEEGGPYIAVVLDRHNKPNVTFHGSYAEAERQLQDAHADLKQTSLSHRSRIT